MKALIPYFVKIIDELSGARPLFIILPLLMILLVIGTVAQKYMGIYDAQNIYFSSLVVWFGFVPFPGGVTLLGIFFVNLLFKFLFKSDWSWRRAGVNISHFGVIVLVFGGLLTATTAREGFLALNEGESKSYVEDYYDKTIKRDMPFTVKLQKFEQDMHMGTDMARGFKSTVQIIDGVDVWTSEISMNEPLRYKGLTLYQSSFDKSGDINTSVLSVVENQGRIFPYIASFIISFGLIWHLIRKIYFPKRVISSVVLLMSLLLPVSAHAENLPMEDFAKLPILQDGRIKPIDSFARFELKKLSGKDNLSGVPAINWLATTIFDPATAAEMPVFAVNNPATRHALGLVERKDMLYSLGELSAGLQKTAKTAQDLVAKPIKDLDKNSRDLLQIHENALEYTQILRSFSAILPIKVIISHELAEKLQIKVTSPIIYRDLQVFAPEIEQNLRKLIKNKGDNPLKYTKTEQELAIIGMQIRTIHDAGMGNNLFKVIPNGDELVAVWELFNNAKGSVVTAHALNNWQNMALAWQEQDAQKWNETINLLSLNTSKNILNLEYYYNLIDPFNVALGFFVIALITALVGLAGFYSKKMLGFTSIIITAAIVLEIFAVVARVIIMGRPPVGTLYESIIFVALVAPIVALLFKRKLGGLFGLMMAAVSGCLLLLLAKSLSGEGDTMQVLGAVLNTNFWLATHVLIITIGYGWCLINAILAHFILISDAVKPIAMDKRQQLIKSLSLLAIFSLLFTTIGTILGGIWADQSWGRFWGWDPKENGALLIVLWIIWILHSKIAGQMSERQVLMAYAFLAFIVALAWIGVNLLGVGLHSYGFMEGVFWLLGIFGLLELIIIGGAAYFARNKNAV